MVAISTFDEIPNLWGYFSANESNITKTGNNVQSIESAGGSATGATLTSSAYGTDEITHDGTAQMGAMQAFVDSGAGSTSNLTLLASDFEAITGQDVTVVWVEYRNSAGSGNTSFIINRAASSKHSGVIRSGSAYSAWAQNGSTTATSLPIAATTPSVLALVSSSTPGESKLVTESSEEALTTTDGFEPTRFTFMGELSTSLALRGRMSLMVIYSRALSDIEVANAIELCRYWVDNGEAPGPAVPTTDSFGPVSTNQDENVTSWKWEESSDGTNWQDVGTILTHTTGANTNTLTIDRATVAMHQTYVRCEAQTATQTSYSSSAQVLIDGEPV